MELFISIYRFFGWWVINIDFLFVLFLVFGWLLFLFTKRKHGQNFMFMGGFGLVFFSIVPVGVWMLNNLENRFPHVTAIPSTVKGMILLGGSFDQNTTKGRGETAYNLAGGRFVKYVALAKAHPHLQLVFTGTPPEVKTAKTEFQALGLDPTSVRYEENSRDTKDNAANTKELLHPTPQEQWLLVTSAYHMSRSIGLFRKVGFQVISYPVDYHTSDKGGGGWFLGLRLNLTAWNAGAREWMGMTLNYLSGRSDELYPAPR